MEKMEPLRVEVTRQQRVRALGFDPSQLTPQEQVELIETARALSRGSARRSPEPDYLQQRM